MCTLLERQRSKLKRITFSKIPTFAVLTCDLYDQAQGNEESAHSNRSFVALGVYAASRCCQPRRSPAFSQLSDDDKHVRHLWSTHRYKEAGRPVCACKGVREKFQPCIVAVHGDFSGRLVVEMKEPSVLLCERRGRI